MLRHLKDRSEDAHIARLIHAREEEGLELLWTHHGTCVRALLLREFGTIHEHDIEHAISDAAFDIWDQFDGYDAARSSLGAWLLTVAKNNLIGLLRREKARPVLRLLGVDELDEVAAPDNQPISHSERMQKLLTHLPACIEKLSPMRQDIILTRLTETDHVADRVLAERWRTEAKAISSARHKARRQLAKLLTRAIQ